MIRLNKLMEIRQTLQKKYSNGLISNKKQNGNAENKMNSFIEQTQKLILQHLEEDDFSANELAHYLHLSRSQVHRKIKALTGMSTSIYIRIVRLEKAKELLKSKELTISEIAYSVGFKSPFIFRSNIKRLMEKVRATPGLNSC